MPEHQTSLPLDATCHAAPAASHDLRDEIGGAWGLPVGERVEVSFRNASLDAITGVLELCTAPDYPWNPRQPLQLQIAGFTFSSRDIARWTRL